MKTKRIIMFTAIMLAATAVRATHVWESPSGWAGGLFVYESAPAEKYFANEASLDLFGSYVASERKFSHVLQTSIRHRGRWGGGAGFNYFITREIGLGVDANAADNGGHLVDIVSGSLIARIPISTSGFAPYIFGGGGRAIDPVYEWTGHAGGGLEFRFNPTTGIFVDGRYVWADKTSDSSLVRAGLRFAF